MIFKAFSQQLTIRLGILFALFATLAVVVVKTNYVIVPVLLAVMIITMIALILRLVQRTNHELARFFDAARYADFSQSFSMKPLGNGFTELGQALNDLMDEFRNKRSQQEEQLRYFKALLEQVPLPLLTVFADGTVDVLNNAARRLFGSISVHRVDDLDQFGRDLRPAITELIPGERVLVKLRSDEQVNKIALSVSELTIAGEKQRLVSLANIQSELEATELQAWQQLVRVLTHEIMNSVTPIASLAKTASELIQQADQQPAADSGSLSDIREAVDTVARRSDHLMNFIQSYRSLTRLPKPKPQPLSISHLFGDMVQLKRSELEANNIVVNTAVEPESMTIEADSNLVEQVLINLISNAQEALADSNEPAISLRARLNRAGRVIISVEDNGPGIREELHEKVFVPFFTTKNTGSGVGLALARQIMRAHKGSVHLDHPEDGGTRINLVF